MLNDGSRAVSHGSNVQGIHYCDHTVQSKFNYRDDVSKSPGWVGPTWYRFTMPAGTRIPESRPGGGHCGTGSTGWLSGVHPKSPGASSNVKFCFDNDHVYVCRWSTQGKVTNCGSYFVYYLENTPYCRLRYCATN